MDQILGGKTHSKIYKEQQIRQLISTVKDWPK